MSWKLECHGMSGKMKWGHGKPGMSGKMNSVSWKIIWVKKKNTFNRIFFSMHENVEIVFF